LEAALALTVAYLAVEILMVTPAKHLAWIAGLLGLFHGLSIAGFPARYSAGAAALQIAVFVVLAFGARHLSAIWRRGIAWVLLAAGLSGFAGFEVACLTNDGGGSRAVRCSGTAFWPFS
jgi:hypothetical protein